MNYERVIVSTGVDFDFEILDNHHVPLLLDSCLLCPFHFENFYFIIHHNLSVEAISE